jgi:predicted deacylase
MPSRTRPARVARADTHPSVFEIGGVRVEAGERRTLELPLATLSTHTAVNLPMQVWHGRRPGPALFVCAAIHGDEILGLEIIRRLLRSPSLKRLRGTLVAIPIVNVFGFIARSRYLPDRRDLNRCFPGRASGSLGARVAHQFLTEVVMRCTQGIDLHTGAIHRANFPQVRVNLDQPAAATMARDFAAPVTVNASLREGSLRGAADTLGIPVIVYEAGEALRFDELAIRLGVRGVLGVMRGLGMLPAADVRTTRETAEPLVARSTSWVRAPASGVFRPEVALGGRVRSGEVLGHVAGPFGEEETDVRSPVDGVVIGRNHLPLVHEGNALYHIAQSEGTQVPAELLDAFEDDEPVLPT